MPIHRQNYKKFTRQLEQTGLDLVASFDVDRLPQTITATLPRSDKFKNGSLVLVAGRGGGFWEYLVRSGQSRGHCFNRVGRQVVTGALQHYFPGLETITLYPDTEYTIPLQQLGRLVGWGRPSILGPDIHPEYGTWFAYRCAVLVSEALPASENASTAPVCEVCIDKPCQSACPVGAVRELGGFALGACMAHRMTDASPCADRCLARLACPVGLEYRYSPGQLAHHGQHSLASITRYKEDYEHRTG